MLQTSDPNPRRIAKHVMLSLQIQNSDELVFVFGSGFEQSNLEALTHWIKNQTHPVANIESWVQLAQQHLENTINQ